MNKKRYKLNKRNSKILHESMVALKVLFESLFNKEQTESLNNLPIHEMQVHLLDEDGDGIVLCLEYDELTGELNKTFYNMDEYYATEEGIVEVELESDTASDTEPLDPYARVPTVKQRLEETISEEYDEIFHNSSDDEEPLLN